MINIPLQPVASSNVHSRGYDPATQTLAILFKDKAGNPTGLFHYSNVTPELNEQLSTAESFGSALRSLIVKDKDAYPFTKIDSEVQDEVAAQLAADDAQATGEVPPDARSTAIANAGDPQTAELDPARRFREFGG